MPVHLLDRVRALAAEPAARLDDMDDATWSLVDPEQLELCRLRIAQLLGDGPGAARRTPAAAGIDNAKIAALSTWWQSDLFSAAEQARLAFTEQFVTSVSSLSDADVQALLVHDDEQAVYQFALAVYVLDMTTRVDLVTRALFDNDISAIGSTS